MSLYTCQQNPWPPAHFDQKPVLARKVRVFSFYRTFLIPDESSGLGINLDAEVVIIYRLCMPMGCVRLYGVST